MKKTLLISGVVLLAAGAYANPFSNGSFESGTDPGNYTGLNPGDPNIDSWSVDSGTVDYIGTYWQAADGARSLDMDGTSAGSISQTFDTVAGQTYSLSFSMAANPDGGLTEKVLHASVGDLSQDFSLTPPAGTTESNMNWQTMTANFTASSSSTTLAFSSLTEGSFGPALDNVSITATPEPATFAVLGIGALAVARRRRTSR